MKYPTRIYYTEADKGLMWDRWQKGETRLLCATDSRLTANSGHLPATHKRGSQFFVVDHRHLAFPYVP